MNMHKENTFSNLKGWCDEYYKKSGLKVHPTNVPVDLVLEDLMQYVAILMAHDKNGAVIYDHLVARITRLEEELVDCKTQLIKLHEPVQIYSESIPETKQNKKVKK